MQHEAAPQRTLDQTDAWQKRGEIDHRRLTALLLSLCAALRSLHREGRVNGHVSPQHIAVDEQGGLSLSHGDWEVAAVDGPLFSVLPDGYAAFEQYMAEDGWPVGPWTDIYGLSAVAYALIVGEPPPGAVKRMVESSDIEFDSQAKASFPLPFLAAIARGLSLDKDARQQSVEEFVQAIAAVEGPETSLAKHDTPILSTVDRDGGKPGSFQWRIPAVLAVALIIGIWAWSALDERDPGSMTALAGSGQIADAIDEPLAGKAPEVAAAMVFDTPAADLELGTVDPASLTLPVLTDTEDAAELVVEQDPVEQDPSDKLNDSGIPVPAIQTPPKVRDKAMPAAPSVAKVNVRVEVRPWGEVFVDGASKGVSPPLRSLALSPGTYQIRIVNGDLPPHSLRLAVKAGEQARVAHTFVDGDE